MLSLLHLASLLVVIPSVTIAAEESPADNRKYIVVIDAGSTGSRIHVYPYLPSTPLPKFLPNEEFTIKKKPGLSSFQDNPAAAGSSLNEIINEAKAHIPVTTLKSDVPIFLVATAGLRKVRAASGVAADSILTSVRATLASSGFKFNNQWAQIIDGIDEGLYGWVTVNYLLNNFAGGADGKTMGVLEMGGESVQLTFLPVQQADAKDPESKSPIPLQSLSIAGKDYKVFAYSWMGYGMEAAQDKFDKLVVVDETKNPCYMSGDTRLVGDKKLSGSGNYQACYLLLKESIKLAKGSCEDSEQATCALDGLKMPALTPTDQFYLIENFWYTANVAGFEPAQMKGQAYYNRMAEFGSQYCATPFDKATTFLADLTDYKPHDDEIQKECFCSAYIDATLKEGIPISMSDNYQVVRNIDGADLDWALGYAIVQEATGVARGGAGAMGYWVYALLLAGVVLGGYYFWRKRQQRVPRFGGYARVNHTSRV